MGDENKVFAEKQTVKEETQKAMQLWNELILELEIQDKSHIKSNHFGGTKLTKNSIIVFKQNLSISHIVQ